MSKKLLVVAILVLVAVGFGVKYYLKSKNDDTDIFTYTSSTGPAKISENSSLGKYLTDQAGMTLYVFKGDETESGPVQSTCKDACAKTWPPFIYNSRTWDANDWKINPISKKMAIFERTTGVFQYAFGRQPFYHYSGDKNPGDTNGQGIDNNWSVVLVSR